MIQVGKFLHFCINFAGGSSETTPLHINNINSKLETMHPAGQPFKVQYVKVAKKLKDTATMYKNKTKTSTTVFFVVVFLSIICK